MVSDRSNGIYRGFIAALIGLVLIGAGEPPKPNKRAQNTETQNHTNKAANLVPSPVAVEIVKFIEKDRGCEKGDDKRDSDLCAQRKAAEAASDAAQYAVWTLLISAIGTGLLVWTLRETRQASRRELRAYISIHPCGINATEGKNVRTPLEFINGGQTPAYDLKWFSTVIVHEGDPDNFIPDFRSQFGMLQRNSDAVLGANGNIFVYRFFDYSVCERHLKDIVTKKSSIIHFGFVDYKDIFKKKRRTYFSFYHHGEDLSAANSKRCIVGNSAT